MNSFLVFLFICAIIPLAIIALTVGIVAQIAYQLILIVLFILDEIKERFTDGRDS